MRLRRPVRGPLARHAFAPAFSSARLPPYARRLEEPGGGLDPHRLPQGIFCDFHKRRWRPYSVQRQRPSRRPSRGSPKMFRCTHRSPRATSRRRRHARAGPARGVATGRRIQEGSSASRLQRSAELRHPDLLRSNSRVVPCGAPAGPSCGGLRISRTVLSAGSFLLIDFCLIFVPFGHYDEPEILRYAITSIRPKGADVRHSLEPDAYGLPGQPPNTAYRITLSGLVLLRPGGLILLRR